MRISNGLALPSSQRIVLPRTELSLFSGYGGFSLGLKLAVPSIRTVGYCEREAYPAAVLVARMEEALLDQAPLWDDVATFDGHPWRGKVDLISGGFPCQNISLAGNGKGLEGAASGLWFEYARIIREAEPRFVFVENVPPLLSRGIDRVLGDLADLGFDAEWCVFSATEIGAPHLRERIFILAHRPVVNPQSERCAGLLVSPDDSEMVEDGEEGEQWPDRGCRGLLPFPPGPDDRAGWGQVPGRLQALCSTPGSRSG